MSACLRAYVRILLCVRVCERSSVRLCACACLCLCMCECIGVLLCVCASVRARARTCCMSDHVLASRQRTSVTNQSIVCHSSNKAVFGYFIFFNPAQAASDVSPANDFRVKSSTTR